VIVCDVLVDTAKVWLTGAAAPYMPSPTWFASIVHEPAATVVIDSPLTVQMPGVSVVRATVSPDDAVAPDAKVTPGAFAPGLAKLIVWLCVDTANDSVYAAVLSTRKSFTRNVNDDGVVAV
jgi:hypothetical protein